MNRLALDHIFTNYTEKFSLINNADNDENYKWRIAACFRLKMDMALSASAEDFPEKLQRVCHLTSNLIDNAYRQPFSALCRYAKTDGETIQKLFLDLFAADDGDLVEKQEKIKNFVAGCESLRKKYDPDSWRYVTDQRTAMAYLGLYAPEENYLYKYSQATAFADCVEFLDDWGSGSHFKLDIYYKMCDELVSVINESPALLQTHRSRFDTETRAMYPDPNYHLLAFDIIYCCTAYNLFQGIDFEHTDSRGKQRALERQARAKALLTDLEKAREDMQLLEAARNYFLPLGKPGTEVRHRQYGKGVIIEQKDNQITVQFANDVTKKFMTLAAYGKGFLTANREDFPDKVRLYRQVVEREQYIPDAVRRCEKALIPYIQYFD